MGSYDEQRYFWFTDLSGHHTGGAWCSGALQSKLYLEHSNLQTSGKMFGQTSLDSEGLVPNSPIQPLVM